MKIWKELGYKIFPIVRDFPFNAFFHCNFFWVVHLNVLSIQAWKK
jgi:hypothetical protein